jgi:hypothetical protein
VGLYEHVPHPRIKTRQLEGPARVAHQRFAGKSTIGRVNALIGLKITLLVGTMWCAYAFAALALVSLPDAIRAGRQSVISWIAQTFLQLVLLSIIIVGQNVQARASDKRSDQTFQDAEAILSESLQIHEHLEAQDAKLILLEQKLGALLLRSWPEKRTQ